MVWKVESVMMRPLGTHQNDRRDGSDVRIDVVTDAKLPARKESVITTRGTNPLPVTQVPQLSRCHILSLILRIFILFCSFKGTTGGVYFVYLCFQILVFFFDRFSDPLKSPFYPIWRQLGAKMT